MARTFWAWTLLVLGPPTPPALAQAPAGALLPSDQPIEQAIDHYIQANLQASGAKAAPLANDAALLRRLSLDLVGRIPTIGETAEYLASTDPDKKVKLVDRL